MYYIICICKIIMPIIVKSPALKDIRYYTFFGHQWHNYSCFKFLCIGK